METIAIVVQSLSMFHPMQTRNNATQDWSFLIFRIAREVANDDNDAMINVAEEERGGEEREAGTRHSAGVANDEEEEPEDREKTRSRRRHYPRWVAGRRDAAISTYRPPRLPAFPASLPLLAVSHSLFLSIFLSP